MGRSRSLGGRISLSPVATDRYPMPDLNADLSLFNLNNRGANGSLQTARNTYNQLLTDMNWGSASFPDTPVMLSVSSQNLANGDRQEGDRLIDSNRNNFDGGSKFSNYYLANDRSALTVSGTVDYGWGTVDFEDTKGFTSLTFLGSMETPYRSRSGSAYGYSDHLYFVRNGNELWFTTPLEKGAQKVFTFDRNPNGPTIQAIYERGANQLVVETNEGAKSLTFFAQVDPTSALQNGNYRALKDLAWEIGGAALAKEVVIPEFDTTGWSIKGIRDYDGDGDVDIFWRNNSSGQGVFWQMNGLKFEKGVLAGPQADYNGWQIRGFGDFDRDGDQDMFWQHYSGLNVIWEMQGLNFKSGSLLPNTTKDWYFSGIGNFNGDRNLEILWRNANGTLVTWEVEGFKLKSGTVSPINVAGWSVQSVTDFDNDGDSDILWRSDNGITMVLWEMQSGQFKAGALLPVIGLSNANYRASYGSNLAYVDISDSQPRYGGQFDVNGDGKLDIWWKSQFTGLREAWTFKRNSQNILDYAGTLTK
jgi:FG-GAP-like repeat